MSLLNKHLPTDMHGIICEYLAPLVQDALVIFNKESVMSASHLVEPDEDDSLQPQCTFEMWVEYKLQIPNLKKLYYAMGEDWCWMGFVITGAFVHGHWIPYIGRHRGEPHLHIGYDMDIMPDDPLAVADE